VSVRVKSLQSAMARVHFSRSSRYRRRFPPPATGTSPWIAAAPETSRKPASVGGHAGTVDAVVKALKTRGVEITEDGVRLIKKPHR
jgi:hypothetical protein